MMCCSRVLGIWRGPAIRWRRGHAQRADRPPRSGRSGAFYRFGQAGRGRPLLSAHYGRGAGLSGRSGQGRGAGTHRGSGNYPRRDYCTLVTCTPYAINTHRMLVRGTRVPYNGEDEETAAPQTVQYQELHTGNVVKRMVDAWPWISVTGSLVIGGEALLLLLLLHRCKSARRKTDETPVFADFCMAGNTAGRCLCCSPRSASIWRRGKVQKPYKNLCRLPRLPPPP